MGFENSTTKLISKDLREGGVWEFKYMITVRVYPNLTTYPTIFPVGDTRKLNKDRQKKTGKNLVREKAEMTEIEEV